MWDVPLQPQMYTLLQFPHLREIGAKYGASVLGSGSTPLHEARRSRGDQAAATSTYPYSLCGSGTG